MASERLPCPKCNGTGTVEIVSRYTPETNADRIRSMSDDQLAIVILEASINNVDTFFCRSKKECCDRLVADEDIPDSECLQCVKAWLKVPSDERPAWIDDDRQESGLLEEE